MDSFRKWRYFASQRKIYLLVLVIPVCCFMFLSTPISYLRVLNGKSLPKVPLHYCQDVPEPSYSVPFIFCPTDGLMQGHISEYIPFEKDETRLMLSALGNYPQSVLLDIGSNMGLYTLLAAKRGHRVVAVDPIENNLAVIYTSAVQNKLEDQIVLVNNAVSDVHNVYYALVNPKNDGMVRMIPKENYNPESGLMLYVKSLAKIYQLNVRREITSVVLEDVLSIIEGDTVIMKVDIEGFECKALTGYLEREPKLKFIPYILVEWVTIQSEQFNCPHIERLIQGFTASGYQPFSPTLTRTEDLTELMYSNILWVHSSAKVVDYLVKMQVLNVWM